MQVQPSYKQGFARSRGESAFPEMWKGLIHAYVPALGPAGQLRDVGLLGNIDGTLVSLNGASWVVPDYSVNGPRNQGSVLGFDGTNDWIDLNTNFGFGFNTPFTIAFEFMNTGTASDQQLIGRFNNPNLFQIGIGSSGTTLRAVIGHAGGNSHIPTTATILALSTWYRGVLTFNGGGASGSISEIFLDGTSRDSVSGTIDDFAEGSELHIFHRGGDNAEPVQGQLASMFIYNRVWAQGEVNVHNVLPLAPFILAEQVVAKAVAAPAPGGGVTWSLANTGGLAGAGGLAGPGGGLAA